MSTGNIKVVKGVMSKSNAMAVNDQQSFPNHKRFNNLNLVDAIPIQLQTYQSKEQQQRAPPIKSTVFDSTSKSATTAVEKNGLKSHQTTQIQWNKQMNYQNALQAKFLAGTTSSSAQLV